VKAIEIRRGGTVVGGGSAVGADDEDPPVDVGAELDGAPEAGPADPSADVTGADPSIGGGEPMDAGPTVAAVSVSTAPTSTSPVTEATRVDVRDTPHPAVMARRAANTGIHRIRQSWPRMGHRARGPRL
jgi:hypothetical protein